MAIFRWNNGWKLYNRHDVLSSFPWRSPSSVPLQVFLLSLMRFLVKGAYLNLSPVPLSECKLWTITFHTLLHPVMSSHLFTHIVMRWCWRLFACSLYLPPCSRGFWSKLCRLVLINWFYFCVHFKYRHCLCFTTVSSFFLCWMFRGAFVVPALFVLCLHQADCISFSDSYYFWIRII